MEWISWSNALYMLVLILGGLLTLVSVKYRAIVQELKELIKVWREAIEDGELSQAEKEIIMKEALDVLSAGLRLIWKF